MKKEQMYSRYHRLEFCPILLEAALFARAGPLNKTREIYHAQICP